MSARILPGPLLGLLVSGTGLAFAFGSSSWVVADEKAAKEQAAMK